MRDSSRGTDDRSNLERLGESAGAMAGRAADFGMEVTGALFRSAAEMLGGWWSSDAPRQAASSWNDQAERNCRSHYQASGSMTAGGTTGGATQATHAAPKSPRGAMQSAGEMSTDFSGGSSGGGNSGVAMSGSAQIGDAKVSGSAQMGAGGVSGSAQMGSPSSGTDRATSMDSATDGFERARPGYQLGYVARQNPAYRGRSFSEVEPELQRVWESRSKTQGSAGASSSSWPEVRGFVDFAYQQDG